MFDGRLETDARWTLDRIDAAVKLDRTMMVDDQCRLCGLCTDITCCVPIFKGEGTLTNLPEKIHIYLQLDIDENDHLPHQACRLCVSQLQLYQKFFEKCKEMDLFYREQIKNKITRNSILVKKEQESDEQIVIPNPEFKDAIQEMKEKQFSSEFVACDPLVSIKQEPQEVLDYANEDTTSINQESSNNSGNVHSNYPLDITKVKFVHNSTNVNDNTQLTPDSAQLNKRTKFIFQCAYCGIYFKSNSESEAHILANHKKEREANKMASTFEFEYMKNRSKSVDISPKPMLTKTTTAYRCTYCQLVFATRDGSANHILLMHKEERQKRFAFDKNKNTTQVNSGASTKNQSETKQNLAPFSCAYCKNVFPTRDDVLKHIFIVHGQMIKCNYCRESFPSKEALKIHEENCWVYKIKKYREKDWKCDYCSKLFAEKYQLQTHITKWHICSLCGMQYSSSSGNSMRAHRYSHGVKSGAITKLKCSECDAEYAYKSQLNNHMRKHGAQSLLQCHLCSKQVASKSGLRKHILLHTGVKKWMCQICNKSFSRREYLQAHARVHTGERPYECKECGKKFSQRSAMNSHSKLHT